MHKVASAKERLTALNPAINIVPIQTRLDADNIETILQHYDLVLDGTDNFNTRYLINDACVKLRKPNVHGSVFRFEDRYPLSGLPPAAATHPATVVCIPRRRRPNWRLPAPKQAYWVCYLDW